MTARHAIAAAADRLEAAARDGVPCAPVRDLIGACDVAAAYGVQRVLTDRRLARGGTVVGRKIGLTAPAVQRQLGVDQPDFGVLFADMDASDRQRVDTSGLLQPRIEAEIAFVLAADLDGPDLDEHDRAETVVRDAVGYACAAFEIVDSRIADWDIRLADTVADNASSGAFVLSSQRVTLSDLEPREVVMQMATDDELVSEGTGRACLGDPLAALLWLARTARVYGDPLRAGQIVLSGALGPMVPVRAGATYHATLSGLGDVTATFA